MARFNHPGHFSPSYGFIAMIPRWQFLTRFSPDLQTCIWQVYWLSALTVLQELQIQSILLTLSPIITGIPQWFLSFTTTGIRSSLPASTLTESNLHHSEIRMAILNARLVMLLPYLYLWLILCRIALHDHHLFSLISLTPLFTLGASAILYF